MGNTLIQDSATGNIMGLSPGFIPIGMKEHGGIMYIASVNKEGEGEIGTIPSPIIRDIYKDKVSLSINKNIPIDSGDPIQITNKLYPADKFIANLQMSIDDLRTLKGIPHTKISELVGNGNDPCDIILERQVFNGFGPNDSIKTLSIYSPVISYSSDSKDQIELTGLVNPVTVRKKGLYNLNLYSFFEQGKSTVANQNLLSAQVYGDNGDKTSQYWFLHTNYPTSVFPKDLLNATLNKNLKQVPVSNKPGKLAVKFIPETITDFGMLPRTKEPYNTPITYKTTEGQFYTYFPGFYYTSDNGLYVEKLTARVIDESTNRSVDLEYPYKKEILFDRYNLNDLSYTNASDDYEDPFFNGGLKLWNIQNNELGLPHARSHADSNTYILSPIAGLSNHEKTSFKSSIQDKDDSPHSGVFRAVLGDKYQNWYRLEVDYEDQYGGNKGTFTTRFNPYLNDVFGTNLGLNDSSKFEYADMLKIGSDYQEQDTTNVNEKFMQLECVYFKEPHIGYGDTFSTDRDYIITNGLNSFSYAKATFKKNESDYYPLSSIYNCVPQPHDILIKYLGDSYAYVYQSPKVIQNATISQKIISGYFQGSYLKSDNVECFLFFETPPIGKDKTFKVGNSVFYSETAKFLSANEPFTINWSKNLSNTYFPQRVSFTRSQLPSEELVSFNTSVETTNYNWVQIQPIPLENQIQLSISDLYGNQSNGSPLKLDTVNFQYRVPYTHNMGCKFTFTIQPVLETIQSTIEANIAYGITPYFCLTGTNDNRETVYVQRFGKINNTDIVYEHNFEQTTNGAKNFINEEFLNDPTPVKPCSYNEKNPFYCYQNDFSTPLVLESVLETAGIYVLNIQRCPSMGNWTQSSNNPVIDLQIEIGENKYFYNPTGGEKTIKNWSTHVSDTNGYKYVTNYGDGAGDTSNMRIYTPIVLVIPQPDKITINIAPKDGWAFNRQSIGLYKIRDVGADDIINKLQIQESIYLYHDYMKLIQDKSSSLSTVEQYNFIQKYGVFFKEAFVFVDGLYKDDKVNSITIAEKTYQPYPYIPSDPTILPVQLGTDNNYYWNAYYMPEEVLTSDDCNFIFSNANGVTIINDEFKSVKSGNLRQLINQE